MIPKGRDIRVMGIRINHPGRGEPSYITLDLVLEYLKGQPVEQVRISPYVARRLAEDALIAARIAEENG